MNDLLLGFYADDFTGATDALEALSLGGAATALVLDAATLQHADLPSDVRCVGIAGTTRSLSPIEIEAELPASLRLLATLKPLLLQYKICSTFDSSPTLGSIGQAIETALAHLGPGPIPLVVGVPQLGRYCVFGNLFARAGWADPSVYRLDRHPVMSRHPLTPMAEADLREILAQQTTVSVALHPVTEKAQPRFADLLATSEVILCDVLTEADLIRLGEAIWKGVAEGSVRFAVGSSGLNYALVTEWNRLGLTVTPPPVPSSPSPVDQTIVVSASCSAVTVAQLKYAIAAGFVDLGIDGRRLASHAEPELERLTDAAHKELSKGHSLVLHTFPGANSDEEPASNFLSSAELGAYLGSVINDLLPLLCTPRVIVCGGDTSSHIGRALQIERLDFVASMDPGAPLCRATRRTEPASFEVAFKGGQMGRPDFLVRALGGTPPG